MAFDGDLSELNALAVMRMLVIERRSGTLHLWRRQRSGSVSFAEGEAVHASTDFSEGEEAVEEVAGWTHGAFRMDFGQPAKTRSIFKDSLVLLEEAQRRVGFRTQPFQTVSPLKTESEIGPGLLFAGELEPAIAQLSSSEMRTQPQAALEILAEIVNRSIAFLERESLLTTATQTLESALSEVQKSIPHARFLVSLQGRIGIQHAVNTLRFGTVSAEEGGTSEPILIFRQSTQALLMLLYTFLEIYGESLHVSAERRDWGETSGLLLTELARAADGITLSAPAQKATANQSPAPKR